MQEVRIVYMFFIIENGMEDILCYPNDNGTFIPMVAVDKERLKQLKIVADEITTYMKLKYKIKKFVLAKEIEI